MNAKNFEAVDFAKRRKTFLSKLKGAIAVLPAAPEQIRNGSVAHSYRQDSSFFYLTGFEESGSIALFSDSGKHPFQLFCRPKDKTKELWDGKILGPEAAVQVLGADAAFSSAEERFFDNAFIEALIKAESLYYAWGKDSFWDARIYRLMKEALKKIGRTGRPLWAIRDPQEIIGDMRLIKSKAEVARMERAAHISAEAHALVMRIAKPGMFEYEIEAALYHSFRVQGASRVGYGSIVAAGANACCLHYVQNNATLKERELLLVDAGAEFEFYTADITRTFPVSGSFTKEQREIYSAVLKAQKSCISLTRPGRTMREIHNHATEVLIEELKRLKLLKGSTASILKSEEHKKFYPHGTGHWLGMDVHDVGAYFVGDYDSHRKLEPGMVLTIEPGLYFQTYDSAAPAKYKGIGVRIEDDILVTPGGCKVLTSGVPKEIEEVESLCSAG